MGATVQAIQRYYSHNGAIFNNTGVGYNVDTSGTQYPDNFGTNDRITIRTDAKGGAAITVSGLVLAQDNKQALYLGVTQEAGTMAPGGGTALATDGSGTLSVTLAANTTYYVWLYCVNWSNRYRDEGLVLTVSDPSEPEPIPTPDPTLTLSPSSLSAGGSLSISVANAGSAKLTATIKNGSTTLATKSFTGSTSVTCPASWFDNAGVTTSKSMALTVTVTGASKTLSGSATLTASANMAPYLAAPTITIVQPSKASAFPDTWLGGVSYAKISAKITLKTKAALKSVVCAYAGKSQAMSYNSSSGSYELTTDAPITGDTRFTVTATDARSMSGTNSASLTGVIAYSAPSLSIQKAVRSGTNVTVKVTASCTDINGKNSLTIKGGPVGGTMVALTSGTEKSIGGFTDLDKGYTLRVTATDKLGESITRETRIDGRLKNIVIKRSTTGTYVGIGMTPETTSGKSSLELPSGAQLKIGGKTWLNILYPVGSIYMTTASAGPASYLGGTWKSLGSYRWQRTA